MLQLPNDIVPPLPPFTYGPEPVAPIPQLKWPEEPLVSFQALRIFLLLLDYFFPSHLSQGLRDKTKRMATPLRKDSKSTFLHQI